MQQHFKNCKIYLSGCLCDFKRYWIILGLGLVAFGIYALGGSISGSLSLKAESAHLLGDVTSDMTAIVVTYLVFKRIDLEHRARSVGAYIHGVLLLGAAAWVFLEALERMRASEQHIATGTMFVAASVGLVINWIRRRTLKVSEATHKTHQGMHAHVTSDLLQSWAVIVAAPLVWLTKEPMIDLIASSAIAAWMVKGGIELLLLGKEGEHHH